MSWEDWRFYGDRAYEDAEKGRQSMVETQGAAFVLWVMLLADADKAKKR